MTAAALRPQLEALTGMRLGWSERRPVETFATAVPEVDALTHGIPRGCLTELTGPVSSGRTTVAVALLARATAAGECCAWIDASDSFDPESAARAGVHLPKLLWVRCGGDAERALKATDLIVQSGGFGLVAMDFGGVPRLTARRISLTSWFRLRQAVENTPTALVVLALESNARSCASLGAAFQQAGPRWSGVPGCSQLLRGVAFEIARVKPVTATRATFEAVV